MTILSKFSDHLKQAVEIAQKDAEQLVLVHHDAVQVHEAIGKMLDHIVTLAELGYGLYNQSGEMVSELNRIDAGMLANKLNNIRQVLLMTEKASEIGYIELADKISVAADDTLNYSIRELGSQHRGPEQVEKLKKAIERWEQNR